MTGDRRLDAVGDAHRPRSPWTISRTLRTISQGGSRRTLAAMLVIATFGTPSAAAGQAQEEEPRSPDERLAAGLNPFEVPAFALGAQIVLLAPAGALGAGSIAAELDLGPVHFDALFGLFFDEEGPNSLRATSAGTTSFTAVHSRTSPSGPAEGSGTSSRRTRGRRTWCGRSRAAPRSVPSSARTS